MYYQVPIKSQLGNLFRQIHDKRTVKNRDEKQEWETIHEILEIDKRKITAFYAVFYKQDRVVFGFSRKDDYTEKIHISIPTYAVELKSCKELEDANLFSDIMKKDYDEMNKTERKFWAFATIMLDIVDSENIIIKKWVKQRTTNIIKTLKTEIEEFLNKPFRAGYINLENQDDLNIQNRIEKNVEIMKVFADAADEMSAKLTDEDIEEFKMKFKEFINNYQK